MDWEAGPGTQGRLARECRRTGVAVTAAGGQSGARLCGPAGTGLEA